MHGASSILWAGEGGGIEDPESFLLQKSWDVIEHFTGLGPFPSVRVRHTKSFPCPSWTGHFPAPHSARHWLPRPISRKTTQQVPSVGSTLDQRRRRWSNVNPTSGRVYCLLCEADVLVGAVTCLHWVMSPVSFLQKDVVSSYTPANKRH